MSGGSDSGGGGPLRSVVVAGASLAGLSAARALRAEGFDGTITLVGEEPHLPYDRPPLSKELLVGSVAPADLALTGTDDEALELTWRLGRRATALVPARRAVVLDGGEELAADGVVLATGARARRLRAADGRAGAHVLRTLDDALALRDDLVEGSRLVVVGGGFIGAEVASSARARGCDVTVVEALETPLAGPLGPQMGAVVAALHGDHGVRLRTGAGVAAMHGGPRVDAVELVDGTRLPADVVVVGVGAVPDLGWLAGSGVAVADGVLTDARCRTSLPRVVAAGDCAASQGVDGSEPARTEHWTHALDQPAVAAAALLRGPAAPAYAGVPYFWSEQYGVMIQFAGVRSPGDAVRVVEGDTDARSFVAVYEHDGLVTGVLGVDQPRVFTRLRRELRNRARDLAASA